MSDIGNIPQPTPFGLMVTAARTELGISGSQAARRAGISQSRWWQIENGYQKIGPAYVEARPARDTVLKMASALGISLPEALDAAGYESDGTEETPREVQHTARVLDLWNRMSLSQRRALDVVMRTMIDENAVVDDTPEPLAS